LTPYNSCIRSGQTGLFAGNSNEDWFNVIDLLVTNPSLRRDIARQARQEVLSNYSLASSKLGLYEETYGRILAQHRKLLLRGDAATGIKLQICGVDLDVAASHEPNLSNVVQRVNRALSRQGTNGGSYSGKGAGAPARGGKDPVRTGTAAIGDGVVSTEVTGLCPNAGWQSIRSEDGGLRIALEGRLQEKNVMIRLTRLNQTEVILNSDLIEHIEMGADSGHTYQRQLLCGPGEC
jgi:hypothetical protein